MENLREHWDNNAGAYGWLATFATVAYLDYKLPQTLSSYADKCLEHESKVMRAIPWAIGGVIAGHVLNLIPQQFDPIQKVGDYVARRFL